LIQEKNSALYEKLDAAIENHHIRGGYGVYEGIPNLNIRLMRFATKPKK